MSSTEAVGADGEDGGAGPHEFVGSFFGIIIVYAAACGVPAVEGVAGGGVSGVGDRFIELTVHDSCEGAVLVDHARESIGERWVFDSVKDNGADCDLTRVRFAAGLSRDNTREKVDIRLCSGGDGADGNTEGAEGEGACCARLGYSLLFLEAKDSLTGLFAVVACDVVVEEAAFGEFFLNSLDLRAAGADGRECRYIISVGKGAGCQSYDRYYKKKDSTGLEKILEIGHIFAPLKKYSEVIMGQNTGKYAGFQIIFYNKN